jgi:hypothetical protein
MRTLQIANADNCVTSGATQIETTVRVRLSEPLRDFRLVGTREGHRRT